MHCHIVSTAKARGVVRRLYATGVGRRRLFVFVGPVDRFPETVARLVRCRETVPKSTPAPRVIADRKPYPPLS